MASLASKALPAHLKDAVSNGEGNGAFERKHHGKTQSHVVSRAFLQSSLPWISPEASDVCPMDIVAVPFLNPHLHLVHRLPPSNHSLLQH